MQQTIIKSYHLFHYLNSWHLINVEEMLANPINEATAAQLLKEPGKGEGLDSGTLDQPGKLGMLPRTCEQILVPQTPAKPKAVPIVNMALFLTHSCNLRCVYCYGDKAGYSDCTDMDRTTAFQAVDWMIERSGEIKKLHISFFGGEPFLKFPLMKAVVEYAEQRVLDFGKSVAFHATTNATLLDYEMISFIKDHQMDVMISFDGPKEIQDAQRPFRNGRGSYNATRPRIENLLAALPKAQGHAVIVGRTERELVKKALRQIGFTSISIMPASLSLFNYKRECKPTQDTEHLIHELEQEAMMWINFTKDRDIKALQNLKIGSGLFQALTALLHNRKKRHACGAGRGLVAVACSGDVFLCHRFVGLKPYKLGSVFSQELDREEYLQSPTASGVCKNCFARYYCAGGCKYENATHSGLVNIPLEDNCRLKRRELELAAGIIGSLDDEDRVFMLETEVFPAKPCPFDF